MDPDALQDEVDEWVREGIISESQAEAILARYETADPGRSRVVLALSVVGAALVFAGVTLFLATNWEDLSRPARGAVLVAAPTLAYAAGVGAYGRDAGRIGHALVVLGAVLVGPSLFLFEELYSLGVANAWLLLAWTAAALPTGHALDSRPGTGFGLLVVVALAVELVDPAQPVALVGALGVALFALGHRGESRTTWTYRVGGAAVLLGALLVATALEGRFERFAVEASPPLGAAAAGAVAGVGWLGYTRRRYAAGWAGLALVALAAAVGAATLAPETVPSLAAFVVVHLAALSAVAAAGYLGYRSRSRAFVDLATLAALLQTLSFLTATVVDALSGSVALVVAGLVLLSAGLLLERGRRSVLAEF